MAFGGEGMFGKEEQHKFEDPKSRVVGWRNGGGITRGEQEKILKEDREAAQEFLDHKKAIAQGKLKDVKEPLAGLPPTWQAFWSTVPDLDAQAAYRAHQREEAKREKALVVEEAKKAEEQARLGRPREAEIAEDDGAIFDEITKLETEVRQKKQALLQGQRRNEEWDTKLAKVRHEDREELAESVALKRKVDASSFAHGILVGKIRSSDIYFNFLLDDTQIAQQKKVICLTRSNALMAAQISELKAEMRTLLRTAADRLPSHTNDDASVAGTTSALEDDNQSVASHRSKEDLRTEQ